MRRAIVTLVLLTVVGCARSGDSEKRASVEVAAAPKATALGALRARMPERANEPLRIERADADGVFLEIHATGARSVPARETAGRTIFADGFDDTELEYVVARDRVEELRHVARRGVDRSLHYRIVLGPGLRRLRAVNGFVEALDENDVARLRTEPAFLIDANGQKRSLAPVVTLVDSAWSLDFAVDDRDLVYPITIDPAWTPTKFLAKERRDNALVLLPSGKAITLGGRASTGPIATTEIFDPATASWTAGGSLLTARDTFASVVLASGKIFVAGGYGGATFKAEIFDPVAGTSVAVADAPIEVQFYAVASALPGNKVLVVCGGGVLIYDVGAGTWTLSSGGVGRNYAALAPFGTGKVLVAGGGDPFGGTTLSTAQIFDSTTSTWTTTAPMSVGRLTPLLNPIPGAKLLVAGGSGLSSAEIYDPSTNKWTLTPPMKQAHSYCGSVVLPGGKVLVAGGDQETGLTDTTDLFDPSTTTWVSAGVLTSPRDEYGIVTLPSGKVLLAGGSNGAPTNSVEIFNPMGLGKVCIGAGECASTFCVEGVCCEKSSCAADETCAGTGLAGKCAKKNGEACTADAICASGHCADGLCCDTACTQACAACDVASQKGKCVPVAAGDAPHAGRAACPGSGPCIGKCGGVDPEKCTQFPGSAISCSAASCKDGVESRASGCDGAGTCTKPTTRACDAFACGLTSCKTQCDSDADCATGNQCDLVTRHCVAYGSCSNDHTLKSPDGSERDCSPFRCVGSRCADACTSSDSCADGYLCDVPSGRCVLGAPAGDSGSGGCASGRGDSESSAWAVFGMFWLGARLGRRSRRRPIRSI